MLSSDDDLWLLVACAILLKKKKNKKKKIWMSKMYEKRNKLALFHELGFGSKEDYGDFLRMDSETFDILYNMVKPLIEKKNTVMRESISPRMRLSATLRYLATGDKFEDLKFITAISPRSLGVIVMETCAAIITSLSDIIKVPQSESDWKTIANGFNNTWNFPNCLGVVGAKHVAIKKPARLGSDYYNNKKFFSIALMATLNANYEFLVAEAGMYGPISGGGVIKNTEFGKSLNNKSLSIPESSQLPNSNKVLPYVFVTDTAFQMQENLIKPYSGNNLTNKEQIFNDRLNRARQIVDNVFGVMISRFGVLQSTIALSPEKAQTIVLACCYLHNFLLKNQTYAFTDLIDIEDNETGDLLEGTWHERIDLKTLVSTKIRNHSNKAEEVRDNFAEYFINEGAVPWQTKSE